MDSFLWHFDSRGLFSVRSAYKVALGLQQESLASSSNEALEVWKHLWKLDVPNKIKLFAWRACKEILPTNLNLSKKGIFVSHFFIDDFFAANLPPAFSPFCSGSGPDLAIFSSDWKAPPAAVFKLNVDTSCDMLSSCSGLGVVMRNATGIAVFAAVVPLKFCADVERGLLPLLVETDSLNVSRLCNGNLLSRSDVENIIFDIQSLMSSLNIASISFISRLRNGVAHSIAKKAFDLDVPCLWTCSFPVWLSKLFQVDVVSFSSPIGE
ncbi:hypothetical protein ACOSQ2_017862 [Xanthoceras sorbifolium]